MNSAAATDDYLNAAMTIGSMVTLENINTGPVATHLPRERSTGRPRSASLRTRGASSSSMGRTGGVYNSEPGNLPENGALKFASPTQPDRPVQTSPWPTTVLVGSRSQQRKR